MPGFIDGMMPIQLLAELLLIIAIFILGAMILDKKMGIHIPMLLQAIVLTRRYRLVCGRSIR